jgi:hypothetical protein
MTLRLAPSGPPFALGEALPYLLRTGAAVGGGRGGAGYLLLIEW